MKPWDSWIEKSTEQWGGGAGGNSSPIVPSKHKKLNNWVITTDKEEEKRERDRETLRTRRIIDNKIGYGKKPTDKEAPPPIPIWALTGEQWSKLLKKP